MDGDRHLPQSFLVEGPVIQGRQGLELRFRDLPRLSREISEEVHEVQVPDILIRGEEETVDGRRVNDVVCFLPVAAQPLVELGQLLVRHDPAGLPHEGHFHTERRPLVADPQPGLVHSKAVAAALPDALRKGPLVASGFQLLKIGHSLLIADAGDRDAAQPMLAGEIRQEGRKVRHLLRLDALGDQGRGLPRQTEALRHPLHHLGFNGDVGVLAALQAVRLPAEPDPPAAAFVLAGIEVVALPQAVLLPLPDGAGAHGGDKALLRRHGELILHRAGEAVDGEYRAGAVGRAPLPVAVAAKVRFRAGFGPAALGDIAVEAILAEGVIIAAHREVPLAQAQLRAPVLLDQRLRQGIGGDIPVLQSFLGASVVAQELQIGIDAALLLEDHIAAVGLPVPHDQKLAALVAVPAILRQGLSPSGDDPVSGLVGGLIGQRQGPDLQGPLRVPARKSPPQGQRLHPDVLQGVRHRGLHQGTRSSRVPMIDIIGDLSGLGLIDPGEGILLHAGVGPALVLRQAEDPGEEVHAGRLLLIPQGQVGLAILPGQEPEEVGLSIDGVLRPEGPDRGTALAEFGGAHAVHPAEGAALLRAEADIEAVLAQGLSRLLRIEDITAIPAEGHGAVLPHQNTGQALPIRTQLRVGVKHLPQAEVLPEGVGDAPGIHAAGGNECHAEGPRQQQRPGLGPPEA